MQSIFNKEEEVIMKGEQILAAGQFRTLEDEVNYRFLLEEYKALLRQMTKVVKMSDMMQLELKNLTLQLELASRIDVLTGLYNRRYFNDIFQKEWKSALRSQSSIALLMLDIDYFKKYNDTYGHLMGDECLASLAARIKETLKRPRDIAARFGGEEFVVLLPETDRAGAIIMAEELLSNIKEMALPHAGSPIDKILTVSIGVVALVPDGSITMDKSLIMMDDALYLAKNSGRNRWCFYDEND